MAIYHYSAQIIGRSQGRSAIACAAYRAGEKMIDKETGEEKDYTRKDKVGHTQVYAPDNSPKWATDREQLWNEVHAVEQRKNSQFCREINIALPKELNEKQQIELTEKYVKEQYVSKGMVADVCLHNQKGENPHAHIMLTTREISSDGFGKKNRDWNDKNLLKEQRQEWEKVCNKTLERTGHETRIDHRTLEAQGVERVPQIHRGPKPHPERIAKYEAIEKANEALKNLNAELKAITKEKEKELVLSGPEKKEPQKERPEQQKAELTREQPEPQKVKGTHAEAVKETKVLERQLDTLSAQEKGTERELKQFKEEKAKASILSRLNVLKNKKDNEKMKGLELKQEIVSNAKANLEKEIAKAKEKEKILWKQEQPERDKAAQAKKEMFSEWRKDQQELMQGEEPFNAVKAESDREKWIEKNLPPEMQEQAKKDMKELETKCLTPAQAIEKTDLYFAKKGERIADGMDKKEYEKESKKLEKEISSTIAAGRANNRFTPEQRKELRKGLEVHQKQTKALQKERGISLGLRLER